MSVCDPADPMIQLVSADGKRLPATSEEHAELIERASSIDHEALRGLYRQMRILRRSDEEATALQRQGQLGLWVQSRGQEAAQIGSALALKPQDYVFPSYREHGVALARGVKFTDILKQFRGVDHGGWDPREHNFHLYTLVIGSHTLHAAGYAMGVQRDGAVATGDPEKDTAAVAYIGDGATSQGDVSESLIFAAVNQAPLLLFIQNNQWAISEPTSRQTIAPLYRRGEGFGVPGTRVDGNDVLASYAVTSRELDAIHGGAGPRLIEAWTYRMGAHTTSDDPTRYRSREQEEAWARRDPIDRVEALLRNEDGWDEAFAASVEAEADQLGEEIRTFVRGLEAPPTSDMFKHVYAEAHAIVEAERQWFDHYSASFADDAADAAHAGQTGA